MMLFCKDGLKIDSKLEIIIVSICFVFILKVVIVLVILDIVKDS